MSRRMDYVKEIVVKALERISKMKDPEYFRPIAERLKLNLNDCELYQIHDDYGRIILFLI